MASLTPQRLCRRLGVALLLTVCVAVPALAGPVPAPPPHLRAVDRHLLPFIGEGCRRSATFRALIERIEQSDLVVYLESVTIAPPLTQAYLRWVGASASHRFVRVAVKIPASTDRIIALLGHELQHAAEVAEARHVRDGDSLEQLYRHIGDLSPSGYDTRAARKTGETVRAELRRPARAIPVSPAARPTSTSYLVIVK